MDLSKLPRLSQTDPPPAPVPAPQPEPAVEAAQTPAAARREEPPSRAEGWLDLAIGAIVLFMQDRLIKYLSSRWSGTEIPYQFTDERGKPIAYTQSVFWGLDLGLGIFGVALMLSGLALMTGRRTVVAGAAAITAVATAWNLWSVVRLYGVYGFQVMPALAVAFGGYMLCSQWRVISKSL